MNLPERYYVYLITLIFMKAVIFCINICLIISPKIAAATVSLDAVTFDELNSSGSISLTNNRVNYQDFQEIYVPPNNGGPDSKNGSGTR